MAHPAGLPICLNNHVNQSLTAHLRIPPPSLPPHPPPTLLIASVWNLIITTNAQVFSLIFKGPIHPNNVSARLSAEMAWDP